jgi:predicted AlkP superfamily phosphohydrolase/phosphomutase
VPGREEKDMAAVERAGPGVRRSGTNERSRRTARTALIGLLGLAGLALMAAGPGCGSRGGQGGKVLVVGLDGGTWELVQPWIDRGDLPNFQRLQQHAAWGDLASSVPYLSPPAWTTAVTGVNPGRHAIYDFQRRLPQDTVVVNETAKSRRAQPIWRMLGPSGKRVLLMNIPMTDPPDPVNGLFIAGFPHLDKTGYTYPPELERKLGDYPLDELQMRLAPGTEDSLLALYQRSIASRLRITLEWLKSEPYDLLWMVFTATDRIQHTFYMFIDPQNPNYDAARAARYESAIHDLWVQVDQALGEILATAGPDISTLVLSDHGFGPMRYDLKLMNYLLRPGSSLRQWEATHAYVLDRSDAARIYIARSSHDPRARLNETDARRVREKIVDELRRAVDPATGRAICERVWVNEEVFAGMHAEKGPDIVVLPSYGYFLTYGDLTPAPGQPYVVPHSPLLSGWHRMNGVYALRGPHGDAERAYGLTDITPTLLYLLGEPIPEGLDGELMRGVIDPVYLQEHPPRETGPLQEDDRQLSPKEMEQLRRLQSTPYIGS